MKLKLGTAVVDGIKTVKLGYMRAGEPIGLEFEDGSVGYVLEAAAGGWKAVKRDGQGETVIAAGISLAVES